MFSFLSYVFHLYVCFLLQVQRVELKAIKVMVLCLPFFMFWPLCSSPPTVGLLRWSYSSFGLLMLMLFQDNPLLLLAFLMLLLFQDDPLLLILLMLLHLSRWSYSSFSLLILLFFQNNPLPLLALPMLLHLSK